MDAVIRLRRGSPTAVGGLNDQLIRSREWRMLDGGVSNKGSEFQPGQPAQPAIRPEDALARLVPGLRKGVRFQMEAVARHPKGTAATVLLTSVFGPYAQDDQFGSRAINPMELYHNQVTRAQGAFSVRMYHRSWGIMMIQANISAPCTVLDFPTREVFEREIVRHRYDIVGISSIIVNVGKVREMCRMVRRLSPESTIVVGGHVAAVPGLEYMIDADYIVKGEGIRWMRSFLGENVDAPIRHPHIISGFGLRAMGVKIPQPPGSTAATIIPSVGCPMGCNFCTTSAFFGGKGRVQNFYESGADLFRVMCEAEQALGV